MASESRNNLPLIYSCSGCSNIAQLANNIALELDRKNIAEMSCIAGVGGGVPSIVKKAKSGRKIISLDGCHLHCVKNCLAQHGVESTFHYTLTDYGIKKQYQTDCDEADAEEIKQLIINNIGSPAAA